MADTTYEPIIEIEDLNAPVTKGDLKNLSTKTEIELFRQDINERLENLPTKEDFSQLLTVVDKLVGEVKTYNDERNVETHRLKRL